MRDIKFRAWDIARQKMVGWDWFKGKVLADVLENTEDYWILMQYTGLKNVNGVEIYEGDILLIRDSTYSNDYIVRYTNCHWEIHSETDVNTELLEDWEGFCEVIGNIYEEVECLNCGWKGRSRQLIFEQYHPEDNYLIEGEMRQVCPQCRSISWEYL